MRGGSVRSGGRVSGPGRAFGPVRARHRWLSSAALLDNYLRYMCCSSIAVAGFFLYFLNIFLGLFQHLQH